MSGGPEAARLGTLAVIVGGDSSVFQRARPVLEYMGRPEKVYHCGPLGAGQAAKQVNNYAACVGYLGLCEGKRMAIPALITNKRCADSRSHEHWHSIWIKSEDSGRHYQ